MGKLRVNKVEKGDHHFHSCSSSGGGSAGVGGGGGGRRGGGLRTERKTIEKNRRNLLKSLYCKLYSLLPHHFSQEGLALPDQIDEAVKYIKSLQSKLEKLEEKKQSLLRGRKRNPLKSPQMVTHELGPGIRDILICGPHSPSIFRDVIQKIHEGGDDVIYANYSISGMDIQISMYTMTNRLLVRLRNLFTQLLQWQKHMKALKKLIKAKQTNNYYYGTSKSWVIPGELMIPKVIPVSCSSTS